MRTRSKNDVQRGNRRGGNNATLMTIVRHLLSNRTGSQLRAAQWDFGGNENIAAVIGHVEAIEKRRVFPRALEVSPERTAGQTACPEEFPARAGKLCGKTGKEPGPSIAEQNSIGEKFRRGEKQCKQE